MNRFFSSIESIASAIDRLSFREKVMVGVMVGAIFAFILFLGVFFVLDTLSQMQASIQSRKDSLDVIMRHKDDYMAVKSQSGESMERIESNDLRLTPFVEGLATGLGIVIDNYDERRTPVLLKNPERGAAAARADSEKPGLWEESLTISFKRVTLDQFTNFLEGIDNSETLAIIKKLHVRTVWSDRARLDVTMTISTYKKA